MHALTQKSHRQALAGTCGKQALGDGHQRKQMYGRAQQYLELSIVSSSSWNPFPNARSIVITTLRQRRQLIIKALIWEVGLGGNDMVQDWMKQIDNDEC